MAALPRPHIGFVPTPADATTALVQLAELTPADVVYDLGCGDGLLLLQAVVDYGVRGVGVDVDAALLEQARGQAQQAGVGDDRLTFLQDNLFETDVGDATVVKIRD
ncbi:MAG: methyltransferase domain-containing protein [Nodosilinea sp.]